MGREKYDDEITAVQLEPGDQIHLTFMGGDEYVDISDVRSVSENLIEWHGWNPVTGPMEDTVPEDQKIWIKKR